MRRSWDPREDSPSPSISKMSSKGDNGHSRVDSSSRSQTSSYRRSRTPRRKKSVSPLTKRAKVLRGERRHSRSKRSERTLSKRSRASARSRSRSRHTSKDKGLSYSSRSSLRGLIPARVASREPKSERYHSVEKYSVERPPYRGPDKELRYGMGGLKKIIVNMKGTSQGSDAIKREIVNPEGITLVRRAGRETPPKLKSINSVDDLVEPLKMKSVDLVAGLRRRDAARNVQRKCNTDQANLDSIFYPTPCSSSSGPNPSSGTAVAATKTSEGSRPIFDRDEIKNSKRKHEDDEHSARRYLADSPSHSGRRPCSDERYRSRDPYHEEERRARHGDPSASRPKEYGSLSRERHRDERSRYVRRSRSRERSKEFVHERRDRYDDSEYRRSRARLRSYRRHLSPLEIRRINGRRLRSPERGELTARPREKEVPPEGEYPAPEYPVEGHYYEGEAVESPLPPVCRGGAPLAFRGRGAGLPMVRPGEVLIRGGPPVRPVRTLFFPRVPGMGRRLPFPPRLIRPIVRPVIRVIAPVIPVRSPPVIPVRHPVIPLPFQ